MLARVSAFIGCAIFARRGHDSMYFLLADVAVVVGCTFGWD
jgi:hypothetical protein